MVFVEIELELRLLEISKHFLILEEVDVVF
jgi:hypothetical protein